MKKGKNGEIKKKHKNLKKKNTVKPKENKG